MTGGPVTGGMTDRDLLARTGRVSRSLNSIHSFVYFVPEGDEEYVAAGLRPGRMGYFASRSAAMGAVGPEVVAATFYNFNVELVARHIPRAWSLAGPEVVLKARLRVADRALTRLLGPAELESPEMVRAAELARRASQACGLEGRALFAGHAGLPWPDLPHLQLWHAATLLREHRGDGHIAALVRAGLSGIEALVSHTATGRGFTIEAAQQLRLWSVQQWETASHALRQRGLLDGSGALTAAGNDLRSSIEADTDKMAAGPWELLGPDDTDELIGIAGRLARAIISAGAFPSAMFAPRDARSGTSG